MTKEELEIALKEQQSIINKNQRLAREFNKTVRAAKKKQKELKSAFRKERLANRVQKPKTVEGLFCSEMVLFFISYRPKEYGWRPCGKDAYANGFCGRHNPDKPKCTYIDKRRGKCDLPSVRNSEFCKTHHPDNVRCAFDTCRNIVKQGRTFCVKHDPDYERVSGERYRNGGLSYEYRLKQPTE